MGEKYGMKRAMRSLVVLAVAAVLLWAAFPLGTPVFAKPAPLEDWTIRSPLPTSGTFNKVQYLNGKLFVIANANIAVSSDGETWSTGYSSTGIQMTSMNSIAYGGGTYVAVGHTGLYTSEDGITWTYQSDELQSDPGYINYYDVEFSNGRFIVTGDSGNVAYSDDLGITWGVKKNNTYSAHNIATDGAGSIVRASSIHDIEISTDKADNWTSYSPVPREVDKDIRGIEYVNGHYVGVTEPGYHAGVSYNSSIVYSSDGINWTDADSGVDSYLFDVAYSPDDGKYVAVGADGTILTSDDLSGWTQVTIEGYASYLYGAAYAFGKFYAGGDDGHLFVSEDGGATWTNEFRYTAATINGVIDAGGTAVAVGTGGTVLVSSDGGETWTDRSSKGTSGSLQGASIGDGTLVAVGASGIVLTSTDMGVNWNKLTLDGYKSLSGVAYGGSKFVAVGGFGTVAVSSDNGATWSAADGAVRLDAIAFGGGTFVAVGQSGAVMTSMDGGGTWAIQNSGTTNELYNVVYNRGLFVASGADGTILVSADKGATWSARDAGAAGEKLSALTYGNGYYLAASRGGFVITSPDTVVWTKHTTSAYSYNHVYGAAFSGGDFILGGDYGMLLNSGQVEAPPVTYSIATPADQNLTPLMVGYGQDTGETKTVTITSTGSGNLTNLHAALSGANAAKFELTQPAAATLDDNLFSTTFTVKAKNGLAAGTYTATITVSADNMTDVAFTVMQIVSSPKGDVTGDGHVTPADALYITKYLGGKMTLTADQIEVLDMNDDGVLDSADTQLIMQAYLGGAQG